MRGYVSSLTFSNLYYILRKLESHNKVIAKLDSLSKMVNILRVDEQIIKNAISSSFPDFEDTIQYFSAIDSKKIDVIITGNTKDYKNPGIPVMTPANFLKTAGR